MTSTEARELSESWAFLARHDQLEPDGHWFTWCIFTGRGYGKTRMLSEFAHDHAMSNPGHPGFLAARTLADVGKVIVGHPESGLLVTQHPDNPCELTSRSREPCIEWRNGAYAWFYSSQKPAQGRGPQHAWGIGDEYATWDRVEDEFGNTLYSNLRLGCRGGDDPRIALATTIKNSVPMRKLLAEAESGSGRVYLTRGTLFDNCDNLPQSFIDEMVAEYGDTRLGDQEMWGKLLEDTEGSIITQGDLDALRVAEAPELSRIVVGVDPALKVKKKSDKTGIVVCGKGLEDGHLYVLAVFSGKLSPNDWGQRVVDACHRFGTTEVVVEDNSIGDDVQNIIRGSRDGHTIRVKQRTATTSKIKRIDGLLAMFERGEAHTVGAGDTIPKELEDQLTRFTPQGWTAAKGGAKSPDDADAMAWAGNALFPVRQVMSWSALNEVNAARG